MSLSMLGGYMQKIISNEVNFSGPSTGKIVGVKIITLNEILMMLPGNNRSYSKSFSMPMQIIWHNSVGGGVDMLFVFSLLSL